MLEIMSLEIKTKRVVLQRDRDTDLYKLNSFVWIWTAYLLWVRQALPAEDPWKERFRDRW